MKPTNPALRIHLHEGKVRLEVLLAKRAKLIGYGTFVTLDKKGSLEITSQALEALLQQPYRRGLQGLELFGKSVGQIAWGSPHHKVQVSLDEVCNHGAAWLRGVATLIEQPK